MAPPPTLEVLPMTTVHRGGVRQDPPRAMDLDGYLELAMYLNTETVSPAGGSLTVRVAHSLRNRASDFTLLEEFTNITSASSSWTYVTEFYRYLTVKVEWSVGAGSTAQADVELLVVPKK